METQESWQVVNKDGTLTRNRVEVRPPSASQLLIRVAGVGVCFRDLIDAKGGYPFMVTPVTTGHEVSGTVIALGDEVDQFNVGDNVVVVHRSQCGTCARCGDGFEPLCAGASFDMYGVTSDGGYCRYMLVEQLAAVKVPSSITDLPSVSFLHCTAAVALRGLQHAQLRPGERVLVTGAAGGVGVHALQVIRAMGAHAIALTSNPDKVAFLERFCDEVMCVTRGTPFHKSLTERVDVSLELVGGPTFNSALRSVRPGGRVVVIGNVTGASLQKVNLGYLILNEIKVMGSAGASAQQVQQVLQWVSEGKLQPVFEEMDMSMAPQAQQKVASSQSRGRIVLVNSKL